MSRPDAGFAITPTVMDDAKSLSPVFFDFEYFLREAILQQLCQCFAVVLKSAVSLMYQAAVSMQPVL